MNLDPHLLSRQLSQIKFALDQAAIVAVTDVAGRITYVNDKFCEITGYSREELLGQNHRIIKSQAHSPEFYAEMWKTISSGKIWVGEICNRAKNGKIYWVHTTIVPMLGENGKPEEYISIRFEITARKEAEKQLAEFTDKLQKSNRELQDFASIAAHDLQEPLRKVQAFSDRVGQRILALLGRRSEAQKSSPEEMNDAQEISDYLRRMQGAAKRMQTLIDDLLTYSRVRTQTRPFTSVPLNQVLDEVISDLEVRIEQTAGVIVVDPLPVIQADGVQMRQLFQNLLGNALKFHKKGVAPQIRVSATVQNGFCELQVSDHGIGFDDKYSEQIFTIFQRLHGRSEYEGTGVGLAVCRRIVERHAGSITAHGVSGQGARFLIRLPIQANGETSERASEGASGKEGPEHA